MKEFVFNKNEYKNYKEMYLDMATKFGDAETEDYYDTTCFDYSPDILWEFLLCSYAYEKIDIKIILLYFDKEKIKEENNYNDYEFNIIFKVFERLVQEYPNNILEFRDE